MIEFALDKGNAWEEPTKREHLTKGTRVKYTEQRESLEGPSHDALGTIMESARGSAVKVKFDNAFIGGHNLDGLCEYGYGWNCQTSNLVISTLTFKRL